ncbi:MAG: Rieske (2Fe-2S) protein [Candidatus Kapabacteria bacterium]|nr:Rieske (2Fe-2S) protein [Candidatus Kapabacteria bacterium]MBX7154457.1 Rieske (2Fe-2S) protein [Bacteroidota bacterium]
MDDKRRNILTWLLNGSIFIITAKAIHSFIRGESLTKIQQPGKVYVGKASELFASTIMVNTVINNLPIVIYKESDEYKGLLLVCTHAACTLHFAEKSDTFLCGCHGGEFYKNGKVKTPPPQKDMTMITVRQHGDELWVVMPKV